MTMTMTWGGEGACAVENLSILPSVGFPDPCIHLTVLPNVRILLVPGSLCLAIFILCKLLGNPVNNYASAIRHIIFWQMTEAL